jgi:hypothetical protein
MKKLLDKFTEFLSCQEAAELTLRQASCGFCWWTVEVLFDGEGKMYLHIGWKKFARAHEVEVGC